MHVCMYLSMYVCMYVYVHVFMSSCVHVCISARMCVCLCTYACIHLTTLLMLCILQLVVCDCMELYACMHACIHTHVTCMCVRVSMQASAYQRGLAPRSCRDRSTIKVPALGRLGLAHSPALPVWRWRVRVADASRTALQLSATGFGNARQRARLCASQRHCIWGMMQT